MWERGWSWPGVHESRASDWELRVLEYWSGSGRSGNGSLSISPGLAMMVGVTVKKGSKDYEAKDDIPLEEDK